MDLRPSKRLGLGRQLHDNLRVLVKQERIAAASIFVLKVGSGFIGTASNGLFPTPL